MMKAKPKNRHAIRKLIAEASQSCCGTLDDFGVKRPTKVTAVQLDRDTVALEHDGTVLLMRLADYRCGVDGVGAFGLCLHGRYVYRWLHKKGKLTLADMDEIAAMTQEHEDEAERAKEKQLLDILAKRYGYTLAKSKK
jgi:hypothetical protein